MQETLSFDVGRAMLEDYLDGFPARLEVDEAQPLHQALMRGVIAPDARLLTFEYGDQFCALPMTTVLATSVGMPGTGSACGASAPG